MVKAWYLNNETTDHNDPAEFLSLEELYKKTGVEHFSLNVDTYTTDGMLDKIRKERGYSYEDDLVLDASLGMPNYEEKLKSFFTEHLHPDEEIRFILDGSGRFDVRDGSDQWIRILVSAGDMVVLPGSIYHRFSLNDNKYIKMKRYFIGHPVWTAHNRPADHLPCRQLYVQRLQQGFATAR